MIEECGGVRTTDKYWDCECDNNYIHPKSQFRCDICGATSDACPDSHVVEVVRYLDIKAEDL